MFTFFVKFGEFRYFQASAKIGDARAVWASKVSSFGVAVSGWYLESVPLSSQAAKLASFPI